MQGNRLLRFNVFAWDLNYLERQEPQNCILEASMQLLNFPELQIGKEIYEVYMQCRKLFSFLTGTLITLRRYMKLHKN